VKHDDYVALTSKIAGQTLALEKAFLDYAQAAEYALEGLDDADVENRLVATFARGMVTMGQRILGQSREVKDYANDTVNAVMADRSGTEPDDSDSGESVTVLSDDHNGTGIANAPVED
jgi:hypothetical protein